MLVWDSLFGFTFGHPLMRRNHSTKIMKKEFIGPGLHLRPVCVGCARPPLQWTLNSLLNVCGNGNGRIRPPLDGGTLKIISRLLIA